MNYTIEAKMSGTGTIHDIASDLQARHIVGRGDYAVVLASYYGGKGYTTHMTEATAIRQSRKVRAYSHEIIDGNGRRYLNTGDQLILDD